MGESELYSLIPKDKLDIEAANAAIALGYPAVAPILPELLQWLQDYNWPVAKVLKPFLSSIGLPLLPHLRAIFETDDEMWKEWIMTLLLSESTELRLALHGELERSAYSPTEREVVELVDQTARDLLKMDFPERA